MRKAKLLEPVRNRLGDIIKAGTIVDVEREYGKYCSIWGEGELGYYRFKGKVDLDGIPIRLLEFIKEAPKVIHQCHTPGCDKPPIKKVVIELGGDHWTTFWCKECWGEGLIPNTETCQDIKEIHK